MRSDEERGAKGKMRISDEEIPRGVCMIWCTPYIRIHGTWKPVDLNVFRSTDNTYSIYPCDTPLPCPLALPPVLRLVLRHFFLIESVVFVSLHITFFVGAIVTSTPYDPVFDEKVAAGLRHRREIKQRTNYIVIGPSFLGGKTSRRGEVHPDTLTVESRQLPSGCSIFMRFLRLQSCPLVMI